MAYKPLRREAEEEKAQLKYNRPLNLLNLPDLKNLMLMMGWTEDTSADDLDSIKKKLVKNSKKYGNALFVYDINV